ncbi:MAG: SagB/ThcOx family dehydrogenase [Spirochaetota bacterium]|nr:SagB/ThcOx family dehydrogenase [Spirochaetota bacterium]
MEKLIKLADFDHTEKISLKEALSVRRSVREYHNKQINFLELSKILWSAQGITSSDGYRTSPSAGAIYPLEVYVVVGNVDGLDSGVYKYKAFENGIIKIADGDKRDDLMNACLEQEWLKYTSAIFVISGVYDRTYRKYGDRATRYIYIEVGHVGQNILLETISLNLKSGVVGAFYEDELKKLLKMPEEEEPLYVLAVGK